jgi:hypothetical protein
MPTLALLLFRFARLLFSGHAAVRRMLLFAFNLRPSSDNGDDPF